MLKWISKKCDGTYGLAGWCEHGNEPWGSMKSETFWTKRRAVILSTVTAQWSWLRLGMCEICSSRNLSNKCLYFWGMCWVQLFCFKGVRGNVESYLSIVTAVRIAYLSKTLLHLAFWRRCLCVWAVLNAQCLRRVMDGFLFCFLFCVLLTLFYFLFIIFL
jgi:hypothetical protein